MAEFANTEHQEQIRESLERLAGKPLEGLMERAFEQSPNPDQALVYLERWVKASSNPSMQAENLLLYPSAARLMATLMGASQPIADCLVQNPELAGMLFEPDALDAKPSVGVVLEEGRALLKSTTSYTHSLDRLRYLRQKWTLLTVVNDLYRRWDEELVWQALSDIADASIVLAVEVVRAEYCARKAVDALPDLMVIGFGKLGGRELNYSSDVDLAFVCPDGVSEKDEVHLARLAEMLTRALGDRMGRGSLYRVDLRLRPYGGTGPLVRSMRSYEGYYRSYAENWEKLALIRARPVCGPKDLVQRWLSMRLEHCFRERVSDMAIEETLQIRARIEQIAEGDDLKRGAGGIRDVEFYTQLLQTIRGHEFPEAMAMSTCDALRGLAANGVVDPEEAQELIVGYRFLRQLEHRCQLVGDVQTHSVPVEPARRLYLARSMGLRSWDGLSRQLKNHRQRIRAITSKLGAAKPADVREKVLRRFGLEAQTASAWLDGLDEAEAYYRALEENEGSLERMAKLVAKGPALLGGFRSNLALTEQVLSGEIEEESDLEERFRTVRPHHPPQVLANTVLRLWLAIAGRWVLSPTFDLCRRLTLLTDLSLKAVAERVGVRFAAIVLGSYAIDEHSLASDADLLFLVEDGADHRAAEESAQAFLLEVSKLHQFGAPLQIDLRLRPEGSKGLLVRSYDGFQAYEATSMEMWERFALGQARLLWGDPSALELVLDVAYRAPLTPDRLDELAAMKRRIETERVPAGFDDRHVKLGHGGISDIDWFVHLHEMRYPTATDAARNRLMEDRVHALGAAGLINVAEQHQLLTARRYLLDLRNWLVLLGCDKDIVPENPDRLARLAEAFGDANGNAFLRRHGQVVETVRDVFLAGLDRLKARA